MLAGLDVLVEPQRVRWVVLFLDLYQPSVVRPVRFPHKLVARFAQRVDVHPVSKGLQIVAQSSHPSNRIRLRDSSVISDFSSSLAQKRMPATLWCQARITMGIVW